MSKLLNTPNAVKAAILELASYGYVVIDPEEVSDAEALKILAQARQGARERREDERGPTQ